MTTIRYLHNFDEKFAKFQQFFFVSLILYDKYQVASFGRVSFEFNIWYTKDVRSTIQEKTDNWDFALSSASFVILMIFKTITSI